MRFLTLRQFGVRLPGWYVVPRRLAITPSRPCVDGGGQQLGAIADAMGGHHPVVAGLDEIGQQPPSILVRQLDRVLSLDREHIEDVERDLPFVALDELEPRPAVVVEHHQLAVEDRPPGVDTVGEIPELGPLRRHVEQVARLQADAAVVDERERAVTVPLDLVGPARRRRAAAC